MEMNMTRINPLGIIAATVAVSILGGVWFTAIFGKAYAAVLGRPHDPKAKMPPLFYVGPMICTLLTVTTSAFAMRALGTASIGSAVLCGAVVGAGFLGVTAVNMAINPNIPKPVTYGLLSAGFFFVSSVLMDVTLYWLR